MGSINCHRYPARVVDGQKSFPRFIFEIKFNATELSFKVHEHFIYDESIVSQQMLDNGRSIINLGVLSQRHFIVKGFLVSGCCCSSV